MGGTFEESAERLLNGPDSRKGTGNILNKVIFIYNLFADENVQPNAGRKVNMYCMKIEQKSPLLRL